MPPRRFSNIQHPNAFNSTLSNLLILLVILLVVLAVLLALGLRRPQNFLTHQSDSTAGSLPQKSLDVSDALAETPQEGKETPQPPCNCAALLADATTTNLNVAAGEAFTQTWRIKNIGTCPWNRDYKIVFATGTDFGGPQAQTIGTEVGVGETVDILLALVAPTSPQGHAATYQLHSDAGIGFGVNENCDQPLSISVTVAGE